MLLFVTWIANQLREVMLQEAHDSSPYFSRSLSLLAMYLKIYTMRISEVASFPTSILYYWPERMLLHSDNIQYVVVWVVVWAHLVAVLIIACLGDKWYHNFMSLSCSQLWRILWLPHCSFLHARCFILWEIVLGMIDWCTVSSVVVWQHEKTNVAPPWLSYSIHLWVPLTFIFGPWCLFNYEC